MTTRSTDAGLSPALPFWLSLTLVPILFFAASNGGWALVLPPLASWGLFSLLDGLLGKNERNADPETDMRALFWHRLILRIWFPVQALTVFGLIRFVSVTGNLSTGEAFALFFGVGILSGTVGIVYAHELAHARSRLDRWMGDLLLASVLYGHFRSEHLLVHHVHVGTPRDAVTARYNEGFFRFFCRVLPSSLKSAWKAEQHRLERRGLGPLSRINPFWRYAGLQAAFLGLAFALGGWFGTALFVWQAFVAIWQLELVNYVEHYGLERRRLFDGSYEPVRPHHSWNATQTASNWLLINLQRHSDHHTQPMRPFPLLQAYDADTAPMLPFGYPVMTLTAMIPPVWRRMMNPRVRAWRRHHYPDLAPFGAAMRA